LTSNRGYKEDNVQEKKKETLHPQKLHPMHRCNFMVQKRRRQQCIAIPAKATLQKYGQ